MLKARALHRFAVFVGIVAIGLAGTAGQSPSPPPRAMATSLVFGGKTYVHRWSKNGQNEYTPPSEPDLDRWREMVTLNVNESVRNGEELAAVANSILANYQKHGKIVRTDSKPRTAQRPAEHLIVALPGDATLLEAAFARIMLNDGVAVVAVYSHRVYGKDAARPMGDWLQTNGPAIEKTLMSWDRIPQPVALKRLPQSK